MPKLGDALVIERIIEPAGKIAAELGGGIPITLFGSLSVRH